MKKIYFITLAFLALFTANLNAQSTIYSSSFDEASYDDAGVQDNLNNHPDWLSGHFNNANTWKVNGGADLIRVGANFSYSLLSSTAITAQQGDKITLTTAVRLGNDNQPFNTDASFGNSGGDVDMYVFGLAPNNAPVSSDLGQLRDGILIRSRQTGTLEAVSNGGGSFTTNPSMSTADKAYYLFVVEYTIGADAATSSKSVRFTNLGNDATTAIETSTGIKDEIYTALTGSGAYVFNWALNFYQKGNSTINGIYVNRIEITKNSPVLSTENFNNFDFSIAPNPVNDILKISTKETINKVEVFNVLGKRVLTSTMAKDYIDVSSLSKSIYILKLSSDKGTSTIRFVKE